MDFQLQIQDAENDDVYTLKLNEQDYNKACNDEVFASLLLKHARESSLNAQELEKINAPIAVEQRRSLKNAVGNLSGSVPEFPTTSNPIERSTWTHNEILQLISLYEENQHLYKSTTVRKEQFWMEMANKISGKTADQCRNKFKYLKSAYVKKKDNMSVRKTGEEKIRAPYFEEMDAIFQKDHNVTPVAVASSLKHNFPDETLSESEEKPNEETPRKKVKTEKEEIKKRLDDREANAERRHRENLEKKDEALDICRQLLDVAQKILSKK